jgi:wyosine [tRNA(Phe)-imidazoG37] synthetase (radical SAM superfamily)
MSAKLTVIEELKEDLRTLRRPQADTASGCARNYLGNRFVYVVISSRAGGLSIGLNLNPNTTCNFDCVYCEVNRTTPPVARQLDAGVMADELEKTLTLINSGEIRHLAGYHGLSADLLRLRHVAFSGDGEPALCPIFAEAVQEVVHVRARRVLPFFKMVLVTNGTCLDQEPVQDGLRYFTREDEIWIKLDTGTQQGMNRINRSQIPLDKVMENAWLIGRKRPIVIQSLFPLLGEAEPQPDEIEEYIRRLIELKDGGAMISQVQIYSATRPAAHPNCGHIPLQSLARICRRVRTETGLTAEVF